jgi:hypothetical protein
MEVSKGNKTLYHIQSLTDWCDEPNDIFVFSELEPTIEQMTKLFIDEYDFKAEGQARIDDFIHNANVYIVYTEEI